MKYVFLFIIISVCGCNGTNANDCKLSCYKDSIESCVERFQLEQDTSMILKAIRYCDLMQKGSMSNGERFDIMKRQSQLLCLIGKYREAFMLQGKAVELLSDDDIRRLEYYGIKYKIEGDSLKAVSCYRKIIAECDKDLSQKSNITKKAESLIMIGEYEEAKNTLEEYFKKHNDGEIQMLIDKFDIFKEDISTSYLMFKE